MKTRLCSLAIMILATVAATFADDTLWRGTMTPYNLAVTPAPVPDSLVPVGVIHVARHGARYMTSPKNVDRLREALDKAAGEGNVTAMVERMQDVLYRIDSLSDGRWGMLDAVGRQEERRLAEQLRAEMPEALTRGQVQAWSTYVPRAIMSMYSFTYRLATLSPYLNIQTHEGPRQDTLLRFFDTDPEYVAYLKDGAWKEVYKEYYDRMVPVRPAISMVGRLSGYSEAHLRDITMAAYEVIRSFDAMGQEFDPSAYFTDEELMACWKVSNLRHYLQRSATRVSDVPAAAAIPLLNAIFDGIDRIDTDTSPLRGLFYFAHAETLMPLFSLIDLPGCNAPDVATDEVWRVWQDARIVPLAANLDIEIYRTPSGETLISTVLNGERVAPSQGLPLMPTREALQQKWVESAEKMQSE